MSSSGTVVCVPIPAWYSRLWRAKQGGAPRSGAAALLSGRGGRVVAYATTPESGQGRRAKRALTRFVPGGRAPLRGKQGRAPRSGAAALLSGRGGRVVAYATTPESGQGRRAKRALTRFVPGGRAPQKGWPRRKCARAFYGGGGCLAGDLAHRSASFAMA